MGAVITDPFIGEAGDYDTFVATLRMRSGALCMIDNTRLASYDYDERIEAFGTAGMIEAPRIPVSPNNRTAGLRLASSDFPQNLTERAGRSYAIAMNAFASFLLDGSVEVPKIHDGLAAQFIAEAALVSSSENRTVTIEEIRKRYSCGEAI